MFMCADVCTILCVPAGMGHKQQSGALNDLVYVSTAVVHSEVTSYYTQDAMIDVEIMSLTLELQQKAFPRTL